MTVISAPEGKAAALAGRAPIRRLVARSQGIVPRGDRPPHLLLERAKLRLDQAVRHVAAVLPAVPDATTRIMMHTVHHHVHVRMIRVVVPHHERLVLLQLQPP